MLSKLMKYLALGKYSQVRVKFNHIQNYEHTPTLIPYSFMLEGENLHFNVNKINVKEKCLANLTLKFPTTNSNDRLGVMIYIKRGLRTFHVSHEVMSKHKEAAEIKALMLFPGDIILFDKSRDQFKCSLKIDVRRPLER